MHHYKLSGLIKFSWKSVIVRNNKIKLIPYINVIGNTRISVHTVLDAFATHQSVRWDLFNEIEYPITYSQKGSYI